jgi:hypothetical protein
MGCHHFNFNGGHGIITLANIYQYKGFTFEFHSYLGPVKLKKKDWEPTKSMGGRKFFKVTTEWDQLSKKEKEKTRLYG